MDRVRHLNASVIEAFTVTFHRLMCTVVRVVAGRIVMHNSYIASILVRSFDNNVAVVALIALAIAITVVFGSWVGGTSPVPGPAVSSVGPVGTAV